jgi:rhamnose utilization protein RhaD (predicted bifunctional aldolase and dehydrogenase)
MQLLADIVALSHEFGTADYICGGGGNTSVKNADTLWVKPSGTTLSGLTAEKFVSLSRAALPRLYTLEIPDDSHAREALVKEAMAAAVLPGNKGRPSVEAPLHDVLVGTFVVHTHPALVNGMTCSKNGAATCARLFPDALWIPYIDPGFTLCMDVRKRVIEFTAKHKRPPLLLFLESHGVFVTADTPAEIRATYARVMNTLRAEYAKAGVATTLTVAPPAPPAIVEMTSKAIADLLGENADGIAYSGPFPIADGPLTPDHIVYAKSFPYTGPLTRAKMTEFQKERGYPPKVIATPVGVFGVSPVQKHAEIALELALDGALVRQLAAAFGGFQYMTDRARLFIENWEVESYRQKQI